MNICTSAHSGANMASCSFIKYESTFVLEYAIPPASPACLSQTNPGNFSPYCISQMWSTQFLQIFRPECPKGSKDEVNARVQWLKDA